MSKMRIKNALVYGEDHVFHEGIIDIENGKIVNLDESVPYSGEEYDAQRNYVIPGLVDIHFHGCVGADISDADFEGLRAMAEYEASVGVTSICPATMTVSKEELHHIFRTAGEYAKKQNSGAHFVGINMEGPFISPENKGAQAAENILACDVDLFRTFQEEAGNLIKLVDIAPEEDGAMEFIEAVNEEVNISIAHTQADYDTAVKAFEKGARHVTHLHNAMPPHHHRKPGVIGAAMDKDAEVELICDGVHVHPSMIRSDFKMFAADKICMISDSMRAAGLGNGWSSLGGQDVYVDGNLATLKDGTIAGSVTNLMDCVRYTVKYAGISFESAVRAASENPARAIGVFDECGSISVGKRADLVVLDKELVLKKVFL